jgi:23S rRNA (cytidine1920-2'-O)/16S rRNA (cytidine1409-2'-O)-methyltransferase
MDSAPPSTHPSARPRKIRLDELLVVRGLAETRSQAQRLILAGEVSVGDRVLDKAGQAVPENADIRVAAGSRYVSRGGLKLEHALHSFAVDPTGWTCADIGASTGGFTDCLLQHGALKVYAIDVGYGQLAWSMRQDPRVVCMERVNVRNLEHLSEPVRLAVVDVSFIGLELVLPRTAALLDLHGMVIVLIKPQFQVGKGQVGKGGVVRDPALHRSAIERVFGAAGALNLTPAGLVRSPITGPAGNVEFLALLKLGGAVPGALEVESWLHDVLGRA